MMKWTRLYGLKSIGLTDDNGTISSNELCYIVFCPDGKNWPRVVVSAWLFPSEVYYNTDLENISWIKIGASYKKNSKSWWLGCDIPPGCMSDVILMLNEAERIAKERGYART